LIRASQAKILSILLKLRENGSYLVVPSEVRKHILAIDPHRFSTYESLRRNTRYNLNNLSKLGLLEKHKLPNRRLLFSLTSKGEELAKELE